MGPAGRQRTTLGQINSKSVDLGPTKPVVRTTRTQQLRNKMIEKKRNESSKLPLKVTLKEVVEERVEAMDISVNLETHELKVSIEKYTLGVYHLGRLF
jgi:propanediol dehydratase small subunit